MAKRTTRLTPRSIRRALNPRRSVDGCRRTWLESCSRTFPARLFRRALNGRTKSTRVCFVPSPHPYVCFRDRAPIVEAAASVAWRLEGESEAGREKFPVTFPPTRVYERRWIALAMGSTLIFHYFIELIVSGEFSPAANCVVSLPSRENVSPPSIVTDSAARGRVLSAKLVIAVEIPRVRVATDLHELIYTISRARLPAKSRQSQQSKEM